MHFLNKLLKEIKYKKNNLNKKFSIFQNINCKNIIFRRGFRDKIIVYNAVNYCLFWYKGLSIAAQKVWQVCCVTPSFVWSTLFCLLRRKEDFFCIVSINK